MSTEEDESRARLSFQLDMQQEGFWFGLLVGSDRRTRARLREMARSRCAELGMVFHDHRGGDTAALVALAARLAQERSAGLHWVLTDGGLGEAAAWESATGKLLLALNERREVYRKHLRGGLVLEGNEDLKRQVRTLAPDLFSIRSFVLEPGAEVAEAWAPMLLQRSADPVNEDDLALEIDRAKRLRSESGAGTLQPRVESLLTVSEMLLDSDRPRDVAPWISEAQGLLGGLTDDAHQEAWVRDLQVRLDKSRALLASGNGQYSEAIRIGEAMLERSAHRLGYDHPQTIDIAYRFLISLYWEAGANIPLRVLVRRFSSVQESAHPSIHHLQLRFLRALDDARAANYASSENLLRSILDDIRRYSIIHQDLQINSLNFIGLMLRDQDRPEEAIRVFRESLVQQQQQGVLAHQVAITLATLSSCYQRLGLPRDVERSLKEALKLADNHQGAIAVEMRLASHYVELKHWRQAEQHFRRSLRLSEERSGLGTSATLRSLINLSILLIATQRFEEAWPLLQDALVMINRGEGIPAALPELRGCREILLAANRTSEARQVQAAIRRLEHPSTKPLLTPAQRQKKRR